jgi:hypothetical protein
VQAFRRGLVLALLAAMTLALVPVVSANDGGRPFRLVLSGASERPGPGDPDGTGVAVLRLNPGQREVCYEFTVSGVAPLVAAHIHRAPASAPGPVVIPTPPTTATGGSGCVSADRDLIRDIIQNPANYYFNVHNAEYPAGALRAQLGD